MNDNSAKLQPVGTDVMPTHEAVSLYKDMVYSIALTHTRHKVDADDVFQEVFLVYHRKQPAFSGEEHRKAWLITTTVNCARQLTTSSWSRKVVSLYDHQGDQIIEPVEADFTFTNALQNQIFQAMRELPDNYRTVMHLFYFEDLPIARIGELLGLQPGTVRVQLMRGRERMKRLLKGADFDE